MGGTILAVVAIADGGWALYNLSLAGGSTFTATTVGVVTIGAVSSKSVIACNEVVEIYTGKNPLKEFVFRGDPQTYETFVDLVDAAGFSIAITGAAVNIVVGATSTVESIASKGTSGDADFYATPNGILVPGKYKNWIGTNMRETLINSVENPTLKKAIGELYRQGSVIGDGGTADVIRFEKVTGILLSKSGHIQKGIDMSKYFQRLIDSGTLSNADAKVASNILNDLKNALGGN